ncbi:hypothetical protein BVRB_1g006590 [Beta vulgaris subsp. vulgaris]|nr:hypothetical protein BVRB_1g006590 [Beta vulgaris subsp. vulgaris]
MEQNKAASIAILAMTTFCMAFCFYVVNASDPPLLQDFCVGVSDPDSAVFVNGKFCKHPNKVNISDFLYEGFNIPGDTTNNIQKAKATLVDINRFPALNTLGVSIARVDFAPFGLNTPHFHHRGSEVFAVMEGRLYAGFVSSDNKLFYTMIKKGDIIAFPQGLVHFQLNTEKKEAYAIAAFGSQNPGRVDVANSLFGTNKRILPDVLTKAYDVDGWVIDRLLSQFNTSSDSDTSILELFAASS